MATTKKLPPSEWKDYFERFTKHLDSAPPEAVSIEVVSPVLGDQFEARTVPLEGFAYDSKSEAFEVWMKGLNHMAFHPTEIWVLEDDSGFVSALELLREDGIKEIIHVHRGGSAVPLDQQPSPPQA